MPEKRVVMTESTARVVAETVRAVRGLKEQGANKRGNRKSPVANLIFWARLTDGPDATDGGYDFRQQRRNVANDGWEDMIGGVSSDGAAAVSTPTMVNTNKLAYPVNDESFDVGETTGDVVAILPVIDAAGIRQFIIVSASGGTALTLARITGHVAIKSVTSTVGGGSGVSVEIQWRYNATEAQVVVNAGGDLTYQDKSGGQVWDASTPLYYPAEINHSDQYVFSVDIESGDYSPNTRPRPLGAAGTTNTHKYDLIVSVYETTDADGDPIGLIAGVMGSHDGLC